jgi:hypothetical protein
MSTNKLTPEERLTKYKESLQKMAEKEGKELAGTKAVQDEISKSSETDRPREPPMQTRKVKRQSLVSPSKRELEELKAAVAAKAREKKKPKLSGRSITMLRVRSKALAKALTEMKVKRERLEQQHDRGIIGQDEYQKHLALLVSEGHELLREKNEIDEEIKILESRSK